MIKSLTRTDDKAGTDAHSFQRVILIDEIKFDITGAEGFGR
jgi:hypothetical protein